MEMCLNLTATGYIDGCGADFSSMESNNWSDHTTEYIADKLQLDLDTAQKWNDGHRQLMKDTTRALGDGLLIGKDAPVLFDHHVNGVLHEGCDANNNTILLLQCLARKARQQDDSGTRQFVYQCHTSHPTISSMAVFLCGAGKDHHYTIGSWRENTDDSIGFASHWNHPNFDKPFGEPLSDCTYNQNTTMWTRIFESGTVVRFNSSNNEGTIEWNEHYFLDDLQPDVES